MTAYDLKNLVDDYIKWLKTGLTIEQLDGACELTTPFLDRHNDHLQLYALRRGDKIILSDDGYVLSDLEASGMEFNTPKRKQVLNTILNGVGVRLEGETLETEASTRNIGQRVHALLQAMISVNDMFVMSQSRVSSLFWEDVRSFLDQHDIRYSPSVKLAGKTGYDHAVDFLIPASRSAPERILQAINSPSRNTIGAYLFTLTDTRDAREHKSRAFAFLNDTERQIGGDIIEALEAYDVEPARWSGRNQYVEQLAA